ncbi:hypothetical protein RYX36_025470, partial [Vicia faba]
LRKDVSFKVTMTEDPKAISYLTLPDSMAEYLGNIVLYEIKSVGQNSESIF